MTSPNPNYDALLSTTLGNYRDTLEDNISSNVAVWFWLKDKGRIKTKSGGEKIVEQLMYGKNSTSASYSLYDDIDLSPQDGISAAEYPWRQHAVTVAIAGIEEAKNSGPEAVVDLLEAKVQQAEITASEDFEVMFQGDGTGNSGKDFLGIAAIIGDDSSSVTTVGGIDCTVSDNAFWRSFIDRNGGTDVVLNLKDISHAYNKASRGTDKPDYAQTTLDLYEKYESLLQPQQRFTDSKMAEAGFANLLVHGAPLVWGDAVPTKTLSFLNSKYVRLNKLGDTWLKNGPFQTKPGTDAKFSHILSYGNLSCSNRKLAGSRLEHRTS